MFNVILSQINGDFPPNTQVRATPLTDEVPGKEFPYLFSQQDRPVAEAVAETRVVGAKSFSHNLDSPHIEGVGIIELTLSSMGHITRLHGSLFNPCAFAGFEPRRVLPDTLDEVSA